MISMKFSNRTSNVDFGCPETTGFHLFVTTVGKHKAYNSRVLKPFPRKYFFIILIANTYQIYHLKSF